MTFTSSQRHQPSSQNLASTSTPAGFRSGVANNAMRIHPRITASEWLKRRLVKSLGLVDLTTSSQEQPPEPEQTYRICVYQSFEFEHGPSRFIACAINPGQSCGSDLNEPIFTLQLSPSLIRRALLRLGFCCPNGELHFVESDPRALRLNEEWLMLTLELAESRLAGHGRIMANTGLANNLQQPNQVEDSSEAEACGSPLESSSDLILASLLRLFAHNATRFYRQRSLIHPNLTALRNLVLVTVDDDPSPAILASKLNISTRSLYAIVKRELGISLGVFISRIKVECICAHLLQHPRSSISQLSYKYGFTNHGRFSSHYRKHLGENPSVTLKHHQRYLGVCVEPG